MATITVAARPGNGAVRSLRSYCTGCMRMPPTVPACVHPVMEFCREEYEGEVDADGRWHGEGVLHLGQGDVYRGQFRHGRRHGHGVYLCTSEDWTSFTALSLPPSGWERPSLPASSSTVLMDASLCLTVWSGGPMSMQMQMAPAMKVRGRRGESMDSAP